MYIIAGENNLTITKQNVHRDNGVGLILKIEIERDTIAIGDLETIVQDIGENALEITVYNDNDEKIAILSGFHCEPNIYAKGSVYTVEFINASENTFQIGRQKKMIEDLEQHATNQAAALTEHAKVINAQSEISINQLDAIDAILTEVFPAAIAEAVNMATEQAVNRVLATLKGDSTTDDTVTEEAETEAAVEA